MVHRDNACVRRERSRAGGVPLARPDLGATPQRQYEPQADGATVSRADLREGV